MITEARIDNLLRCVRNNEASPRFDLSLWAQPCGTFGCLYGNDMIASGVNVRKFLFNTFSEVGDEYGVSPLLSRFLFSDQQPARRGFGGIDCKTLANRQLTLAPSNVFRPQFSKADAMNRLRKFIYYVLHKRELLYDDSGRVRETARRAEGNHMVLHQVAERVKELATA